MDVVLIKNRIIVLTGVAGVLIDQTGVVLLHLVVDGRAGGRVCVFSVFPPRQVEQVWNRWNRSELVLMLFSITVACNG